LPRSSEQNAVFCSYLLFFVNLVTATAKGRDCALPVQAKGTSRCACHGGRTKGDSAQHRPALACSYRDNGYIRERHGWGGTQPRTQSMGDVHGRR